MLNVLILNFFLALFSADIKAEAIKGTIPSFSVVARDSLSFTSLTVHESQLVWANFQKDYLNERGFYPNAEGYAQMKCDNPIVYKTGLELEQVKLYVLNAQDRAYYIEITKPIR